MHVARQRPTGARHNVIAVERLWQPHARQRGAVGDCAPPEWVPFPRFQPWRAGETAGFQHF